MRGVQQDADCRMNKMRMRTKTPTMIFVIALCVCLSSGQGILHSQNCIQLLHCSSPWHGSLSEVSESPSDVTVFRGRQAVFSCVIRDAPGSWRLNNTNINDLSSAIRDDLVTESVTSAVFYFVSLIIPGRVEYNGTRVQCTIENGGTLIESEAAILSIQGLLTSVSGVWTSNASNSSVTIYWTAPFSLDVTGADPDIWYSVLIYNVTDEDSPTPVFCTDCTNITETHYAFTPDYLSPCHVYNFSIIPFNGAGQGTVYNHRNFFQNRVLSADTDLLISMANVLVFKRSRVMFHVLITVPLFTANYTVLCFLEHLNLYYDSNLEQCPAVVSLVSPELTTGNIWQIVSEVVLGENCNYTVHIASHDGAGETNSSREFLIRTRVITVDVQELEGVVVVRCVFRHTLSKRCYVQLVSGVEGGFYEGGCVEGEGEASLRFPGLSPATYTVLVYGLEISCSYGGGTPDYITVVTVSGPCPTSVTIHSPFTDETTNSLVIPQRSRPNCAEGFGVGVSAGVVASCLLFAVGILAVKLFLHKQKKRGAESSLAPHQRVVLERNVAYELHKPLPRRRDDTGLKQCSGAQNTIYEDLK